jgi:DNA (cytosine-5)-methyltransferase 1
MDLFCGAGGSSWGASLARVSIVGGLDAWEAAGKAFSENFPGAKFVRSRLENLAPKSLRDTFGRVDLILASPECTNHGPAKGASERSEVSRETAFQVPRFAEVFAPRWIIVENVSAMRRWSRYKELVDSLRSLGYHVSPQVLNAADFGVAQRRRRLFLICDRMREPPLIRKIRRPYLPVSSVIDMNGTYRFTPLRRVGRAPATLARADRAIEALGPDRPFLIVYYGTDKAGGWQSLSSSLRTITTLDRFALVIPKNGDHVMRMLQVPELKAAMGMPQRFSLGEGSRRERIRLLGNAVCPPVMRAIVSTLTGAARAGLLRKVGDKPLSN